MQSPAFRQAPAEGLIHTLFVDDDPAIRHVFKRLFERLGFVVDLASDCESAVRAVRGVRYDVLVTDFDLGAENGHDVIRAVAEVDPELCVRLVIFTAHPFTAATLATEARAGRVIIGKTEPSERVAESIRSCARRRMEATNLRRVR